MRLRRLLSAAGDSFGLIPGLCVAAGVGGAIALVALDRSNLVPPWVLASPLVYSGGGTGARTLLGAVASSTIGVAGTIFSITIAALTLAAGQMGPRLLRNFTRDRGNQVTLGVLLGTFAYALVVLRTVRTQAEGPFVPNVALSVAILLALACVAILVFFVGHIAGRINVDTVIDLVSRDIEKTLARLTHKTPPGPDPDPGLWAQGVTVTQPDSGYLQDLDGDGLAEWAARNGVVVRLLARPGDFVLPDTPIALVTAPRTGMQEAVRNAIVLGPQRISTVDVEYAVRQLVEVGVRALSPGINDPQTAIGVVEHLGIVLCRLAPLHLPGGVVEKEGRPALVVPRVDYDGLTDTMFHMLRQAAPGNPAVLLRMLEVLAAVASREGDPGRVAALERHARLVHEDAGRDLGNPADRADLDERWRRFRAQVEAGAGVVLLTGGRR